MIKVEKVLNLNGEEIIGLELTIGESFCIVRDQSLPGVRVGKFPRYYFPKEAVMKEYEKKLVIEFDVRNISYGEPGQKMFKPDFGD